MTPILALQTLDAEPEVSSGCISVTWSVYYPDSFPPPVAAAAE